MGPVPSLCCGQGRLWLRTALLTLLTGCQHHPELGEPTTEPASTALTVDRPTATYFSTYHLQSGDLLEALYHIDLVEVPSYALSINDVVELKFFDIPELSLEQVIRPDGRITAPLLGDVHVLGRTPEQATAKLREAYVGTLKKPNVYLVVKDFGKRIEELRRVLSDSTDGQSREIRIGPDGNAVFPIIGAVRVGGMTLARAHEVVSRHYHQEHGELQVELALKETANQLIYVLGEVEQPGAYGIHRPLSLGKVLALAGGVTDAARLEEIVLVRRNGAETVARKLAFGTEVTGGSRRADPVSLRPDDILYVPKSALANAAQVSREIQALMMFRGFSIGLDLGDIDQ